MSGLIPIHAQQLLIQFADSFESLLYLTVANQSLAHLGNLLGAKTELARFGAGIVDIEHPERVAFAASALGAAAGVMNGALQQGAAKNIGQTGESGGELVAALDGLFRSGAGWAMAHEPGVLAAQRGVPYMTVVEIFCWRPTGLWVRASVGQACRNPAPRGIPGRESSVHPG